MKKLFPFFLIICSLISLSISIRYSRRQHRNRLSKRAAFDDDVNSSTSGESPAKSRIQPRMTGGRKASPAEIPYIVEIRYKGNYICAGCLTPGAFDNQIIVTTATCITNTQTPEPNSVYEAQHLTLVAGNIDRTQNFTYSQSREVRRIVRHPDWAREGAFNIAILHLYVGFILDGYVQPVYLPPRNLFYPTTPLTVAGWGIMDEYQSSYNHYTRLQVVTTEPYDLNECRALLGENRIFYRESLCVKSVADGGLHQFCLGDTGSPAVTVDPETRVLYLAGLFSWADQYCDGNQRPSVFVRISGLKDWIVEHSSPYLTGK